MNEADFRKSLHDCQADLDRLDESEGPFQRLFFLASDWNKVLLPQKKVCALYRPPTITIGTDEFQGQMWTTPAHVVLLPYLACPARREFSGRGVSLEGAHGKLKFFTQLDECFMVVGPDGRPVMEDPYDRDLIVRHLVDWHAQLVSRAGADRCSFT